MTTDKYRSIRENIAGLLIGLALFIVLDDIFSRIGDHDSAVQIIINWVVDPPEPSEPIEPPPLEHISLGYIPHPEFIRSTQ